MRSAESGAKCRRKSAKVIFLFATVIALSTLFSLSDLSVVISSNRARNGFILQNISPDDHLRRGLQVRNKGITGPSIPQTVQSKIPKILHVIWTGGECPEFVSRIVRFNTRLANQQGFQVHFWRDDEANDLIQNHYPWLTGAWKKLLAIPSGTLAKGTRLADFIRLVAVYHYGGVYLDVDFIPCRGLHDLVGEPGKATFPWPHLERSAISNGIFSAPPGHPLLKIALDMIARNPRVDKAPILKSTGPTVLFRAAELHFKRTVRERLPKRNPEQDSPGGGLSWFEKPGTNLRLGTNIGGMGMVHLSLHTWMPMGNPSLPMGNPSPCESNVDLIEPFLEGLCSTTSHRLPATITTIWGACGFQKK